MTKLQFAYAALRDAIIRCELAPGERLVIDDLARRFDVSIIPGPRGAAACSSPRG